MTYNDAELDHIELWYRATGDDGSLPDKEFCISPDYITAIKVLNGVPLAEYERLEAENARLTADVYETSRVMLVQVDALNRILEISKNPVVLAIAQKAIDEKWEPAKDGE